MRGYITSSYYLRYCLSSMTSRPTRVRTGIRSGIYQPFLSCQARDRTLWQVCTRYTSIVDAVHDGIATSAVEMILSTSGIGCVPEHEPQDLQMWGRCSATDLTLCRSLTSSLHHTCGSLMRPACAFRSRRRPAGAVFHVGSTKMMRNTGAAPMTVSAHPSYRRQP